MAEGGGDGFESTADRRMELLESQIAKIAITVRLAYPRARAAGA